MSEVLKITAGMLENSGYKLDKSHSNVGFSVKHMMITNVHGKFTSYEAVIDFDDKSKTFKKLIANVDTNSIDTGIKDRDNHLRSDDFFGSDKFDTMVFEMLSYEADGSEGKMSGKLTIRDITKNITLKIEDIATLGDKLGFAIEGKIKRSEFGLKWNKAIELGGVAVGDEVKIKIDIEATRK